MSQLNVGSINVTGGLSLPQFNNTTRPAAPPEGTMIYNTAVSYTHLTLPTKA